MRCPCSVRGVRSCSWDATDRERLGPQSDVRDLHAAFEARAGVSRLQPRQRGLHPHQRVALHLRERERRHLSDATSRRSTLSRMSFERSVRPPCSRSSIAVCRVRCRAVRICLRSLERSPRSCAAARQRGRGGPVRVVHIPSGGGGMAQRAETSELGDGALAAGRSSTGWQRTIRPCSVERLICSSSAARVWLPSLARSAQVIRVCSS